MNNISPMKNKRNNNLKDSYTRSLCRNWEAKQAQQVRAQDRKNKRLRMALGA